MKQPVLHHSAIRVGLGGLGNEADGRVLYHCRFLPDKAIDLIDEAGSRVRLRHAQLPEEARDLDKELRALLKEKDAAVRCFVRPYPKPLNCLRRMGTGMKHLLDHAGRGSACPICFGGPIHVLSHDGARVLPDRCKHLIWLRLGTRHILWGW